MFNAIFTELTAKGGKPDQLMIDGFPKARALLADRGYDAHRFRHALAEHGITACLPSKAKRKAPILCSSSVTNG